MGKFRIVCDICNRKTCCFQFTENGDLVIYCKSCGQTEIIIKDNPYRDKERYL